MNKLFFITMSAMVFSVLLLSFVSSEVVYSQWKINKNNGTITDHSYLQYQKGVIAVTGTLSEETPDNIFEIIYDFFFTPDYIQDYVFDYVKGDNKFEAYVQYDVYPSTWNTDNPNYKVSSCNILIRESKRDQNGTTVLLNKTVNNEDVMKNKYFFRLSDMDVAMVDVTCNFENRSTNLLIIPVNVQMTTPTWECKECQYYEWSKMEADVYKAQNFQTYTVEVSGFIKQIIIKNIEIIFALFWILTILLLFSVVGLIFIGVYWLYLFLKRWIQ